MPVCARGVRGGVADERTADVEQYNTASSSTANQRTAPSTFSRSTRRTLPTIRQRLKILYVAGQSSSSTECMPFSGWKSFRNIPLMDHIKHAPPTRLRQLECLPVAGALPLPPCARHSAAAVMYV